VLVVRATSGIDIAIAGRLALETLSDICLDVIASGQSFTAATDQPAPDPDRPSAILSVPLLLSGTGVGAVLLLAYARGRSFSADEERLVRALAEVAGHELSAAGAFRMAYDRPGVLWSRLDAPLTPAPAAAPGAAPPPPAPAEWHPLPLPPEPAAGPEPAPEPEPEAAPQPFPTEPISLVPPTHRTMTLDPEMVKRLIAEAKAAREVEEASLAAETAAEPQPATEEMPAPAAAAEPEPATEEIPAPAEAAPPAETASEPARARPKARDHHQVGWRARVQSRMTRVRQQRQENEARERGEILAAIRNLSWDGYQALIADIFRRKAFEVLPPPAEGSDLDVIDLVVDRDGQRMLVNCQLRGEMDIPIEAVTEMSTVVYNYSVAGAYLIADGSFAPEASAAAATGGIVLIDGNALIDLTIETTLKDERKSGFTGRITKRFVRGKKAS